MKASRLSPLGRPAQSVTEQAETLHAAHAHRVRPLPEQRERFAAADRLDPAGTALNPGQTIEQPRRMPWTLAS